MTRSAPRARACSTFRVLHTAVTSAPNTFASWIAYVPTPPDAPLISTFCPGWTLPLSRRAWRAVIPAIGTPAASSNDTLAGFRARRAFRAGAYSAQEAPDVPNTSSPGRNSVTSLPTSSTVPARSPPNSVFFGRRSPLPNRANTGPVTPYHSTGLTEVAWTRISTWWASIAGRSTSPTLRASRGRPYRSCMTACIRVGRAGRVSEPGLVVVVICSTCLLHVRCKVAWTTLDVRRKSVKGKGATMLITTANDLPGYEIVETLGEVFGLTVRSRNIGSQLGAGLKSIMGGELKGMTKALVDSRNQVIERMVEEAEAKGGDAVVAMRFDTSEMGGNWTEICAYGTAVRTRKA